MFTIESTYRTSPQTPAVVRATSDHFDTREEAEALAVQFPKGAGVKVVETASWKSTTQQTYSYYTVRLAVNLQPVKGNAKNETGIKRYRVFRKAAAKLGQDIAWEAPYVNSFVTEDDFEAAL